MHETLIQIQDHLTNVIETLKSTIPDKEPFGIVHNNWSFPALTVDDLVQEARAPWKGAFLWWVRIPPNNCRSGSVAAKANRGG